MEIVDKYKNLCRICLCNESVNVRYFNIFTTLLKQNNILICDAVNELSGLNVSAFFFWFSKNLSGFFFKKFFLIKN